MLFYKSNIDCSDARLHDHITFDCEFCTCTTKQLNQNTVCVKYSALNGNYFGALHMRELALILRGKNLTFARRNTWQLNECFTCIILILRGFLPVTVLFFRVPVLNLYLKVVWPLGQMHAFEDGFHKNNRPWIYIDTNFQWTTMNQNIV